MLTVSAPQSEPERGRRRLRTHRPFRTPSGASQYLFATNSSWAGNFVRISVP